MAKAFDYVIVGAGSAGCVLANRLTENRDCRVLLLEAGGWDRSPYIHVPLGWGRIAQKHLFDWGLHAQPEPALEGRRIECARGKVIGGSGSINAMAYVRGHRGDYDRWAASGLPGWSYQDVLPYFRKQESWEEGANAYRGGDGPIGTLKSRYPDPLIDAFIAAGTEMGFPSNDDYNGAEQEGFGRLQCTIRDGRRSSSATGYLRPALKRPNLTVVVNALVSRVVIENGSARGIAYQAGGQSELAYAAREVILSAGAINSPHILMLSGIGDPEKLGAHGIDCIAALRGVGQNTQDHLVASVSFSRAGTGTFYREMRADRIAFSFAKALLTRTGFATQLPGGWVGFVKTDPSEPLPDIQFLFRAVPGLMSPYFGPIRPSMEDGFACRAVLLRPESRGELRLTSADPKVPLSVHQNFLQTEADWRRIRAGVRIARELGHQPSVRPFVKEEIAPGPARVSDSDIDAHIRQTAITSHHIAGGCKMGPNTDATSVVDRDLKVIGIDRLRVVDSSVMPDIVGGNINAAVYMIAEKAADLLQANVPMRGPDGYMAQLRV